MLISLRCIRKVGKKNFLGEAKYTFGFFSLYHQYVSFQLYCLVHTMIIEPHNTIPEGLLR